MTKLTAEPNATPLSRLALTSLRSYNTGYTVRYAHPNRLTSIT